MREHLIKWTNMYDTIQEAADSIGVSKSSVSCWIRGVRSPSLQQCLKIQKTTKDEILAKDIRPDLIKEIEDL